jgi:hypothetical protein
MFTGLLPIGSVVLLKDSVKKVMIVGVCQKGGKTPDTVWDYTGVLFPEGYLSGDRMFMFNDSQVARVFALGYQDEEQLVFKEKVDDLMQKIRMGESVVGQSNQENAEQ